MKDAPYDFKAISEEAQAVMDLRGIQHNDTDVWFPDDVKIEDDRDEYSQPSYYAYKVCGETFVYHIDAEVLEVE